MQLRALREYAVRRGWTVAMQVKEVGSGASERRMREKLIEAARRREIDVVLVWRLDRWGRSVTDLLATLQELEHLGVGFVSLTEALDLTTPAGRAMAGLLAVFAEFEREILRERVPSWPGPRASQRQAAGPSPHGGSSIRSGPQAPSLRTQQIPDRSPATNRPHLGTPHPKQENPDMSSAPTEFHKIWIEQSAATENIRENFGSDQYRGFVTKGNGWIKASHACVLDPVSPFDV